LPVRGKRDLAKEKFWRKALERFAASGKSRPQFCADEGLAVHAFDYWNRVILDRNAQQQAEDSSGRPDPVTFLPVLIPEERSNRQASGSQQPVAEIVFAGGSVLLFNGIGSAMLRDLLRAVRE
jgi:hypothetical protein